METWWAVALARVGSLVAGTDGRSSGRWHLALLGYSDGTYSLTVIVW
jgi:hypothetical protein